MNINKLTSNGLNPFYNLKRVCPNVNNRVVLAATLGVSCASCYFLGWAGLIALPAMLWIRPAKSTPSPVSPITPAQPLPLNVPSQASIETSSLPEIVAPPSEPASQESPFHPTFKFPAKMAQNIDFLDRRPEGYWIVKNGFLSIGSLFDRISDKISAIWNLFLVQIGCKPKKTIQPIDLVREIYQYLAERIDTPLSSEEKYLIKEVFSNILERLDPKLFPRTWISEKVKSFLKTPEISVIPTVSDEKPLVDASVDASPSSNDTTDFQSGFISDKELEKDTEAASVQTAPLAGEMQMVQFKSEDEFLGGFSQSEWSLSSVENRVYLQQNKQNMTLYRDGVLETFANTLNGKTYFIDACTESGKTAKTLFLKSHKGMESIPLKKDLPWIQDYIYGLSTFVRSEETTKNFYHVIPQFYDLVEAQAVKKEIEHLEGFEKPLQKIEMQVKNIEHKSTLALSKGSSFARMLGRLGVYKSGSLTSWHDPETGILRKIVLTTPIHAQVFSTKIQKLH